MSRSARLPWIAAALVASLLIAGVPAYGFPAQSARLGSLATVSFCVRRAGPEQGAVRFAQGRGHCGVGDLRVQVLSASGSRESTAGGGEYVRVEAVSAEAAGSPETASATVACPGGYRIVGGGYKVNAGEPTPANNPAEVSVVESRPVLDTSWAVTAFARDADEIGPWSVAAYATCASAG